MNFSPLRFLRRGLFLWANLSTAQANFTLTYTLSKHHKGESKSEFLQNTAKIYRFYKIQGVSVG